MATDETRLPPIHNSSKLRVSKANSFGVSSPSIPLDRMNLQRTFTPPANSRRPALPVLEDTSLSAWSGYANCLNQIKEVVVEPIRFNEEVNSDVFLAIVKEKEELHKSLQKLLSNVSQQESDLIELEAENRKQGILLNNRKEQLISSELEKKQLELKEQHIKKLQEDILSLAKERENLQNTRSTTENWLDEANARIATQGLVKRVIESKLETTLDEKERLQREKTISEEQLEVERENSRKRLEISLKKRAELMNTLEKGRKKADSQRANNQKLQEQLEKSKLQVTHLIKQISVIDAKAARELKAEKKAKEVAKDQKSRWPTGIVSIAFSDIEASTLQWERYPIAMSAAMELHNNIIREQLRITGGFEVKTEGDSFMVAFYSPVSAIWWCLFVQEALMQVNWPDELLQKSPTAQPVKDENGNLIFRGLKVRMGVHIGKPECKLDAVTGRMDYFGNMINRAARIQGLACGGQIFMSGKVWEAARREITNVFVEHLGEHYLKGIRSPEQIVQILPKALASRAKVFPPLLSTKDLSVDWEKMKFAQFMKTEEEKQRETNARYTQKLEAIVEEIESNLKIQQEKHQIRQFNKDIHSLEKQIRDMNDSLAQIKAEEEVITYQIEKSKQKNLLYEQDIQQAKIDTSIAKELLEGIEMEKKRANATLICANAKSFCLMIRHNILDGQVNRALEELTLLEKHVSDQETIDSTTEKLTDNLIVQLRERISQLQTQNSQARNESEFYIKQVQELETNLRTCKEVNDVFAIADATNPDGNPKPTSENLMKRLTMSSDLMKKKLLSEQIQYESEERSSYLAKINSIKQKFNEDPSKRHMMKVGLLKNLKILDQEVQQIRVERDFLIKQIELLKNKSKASSQRQNKNINEKHAELQKTTKLVAQFERKFAQLTHKDKNVPLDQHLNALRKMVEDQVSHRFGAVNPQIALTEEELTPKNITEEIVLDLTEEIKEEERKIQEESNSNEEIHQN